MKAEHLISDIIEAHSNNDDSGIKLTNSVILEPQLEYSGLMAREAYYGWKRGPNSSRDYVGILDFKIVYNTIDTLHERDIIAPTVNYLSLDEIRHIHSGFDPLNLQGLDSKRKDIACVLQAAFAEQEVNWGSMNFQVWSHFGRENSPDAILRLSAPRDFLGVYLERCMDEKRKGKDWAQISREIIEPFTKKMKIKPPLKNGEVLPDFKEFMPAKINGIRSSKWVEPHITSIESLCLKLGHNPIKAIIYASP